VQRARVAGPALLEDAERRLEDALAGLDRDETALQPQGRETDNDFKLRRQHGGEDWRKPM
jgi:hypothetical protein